MTRLCPLLAAALVLAACATDEAPPPPPVAEADTPLGPAPEAGDQIPADSAVVPEVPDAPPASTPSEAPAEPPPTAEPEPRPPSPPPASPTPPVTQPGERAPRPQPPATGTDRTAVEAFWTRFQAALRARDADRIDDFLHTTVRVSGQAYDRDGPQVREVVRQFAENPDLSEAYLDTSADQLQVSGDRATFSSVARYTIADEPYEATVSGVIREVAPGTWRIVELASETR